MTERQEDVSEFKASLTYPRTFQDCSLDKPCLTKPNTKPKQTNQKNKKQTEE